MDDVTELFGHDESVVEEEGDVTLAFVPVLRMFSINLSTIMEGLEEEEDEADVESERVDDLAEDEVLEVHDTQEQHHNDAVVELAAVEGLSSTVNVEVERFEDDDFFLQETMDDVTELIGHEESVVEEEGDVALEQEEAVDFLGTFYEDLADGRQRRRSHRIKDVYRLSGRPNYRC
jgi:hypothetical protein